MTITDIARMAGVSASTVPKIINGKDEHINPQTRTRVLEIVKEYNFTPYSTVKNISPTKKFLLGVLLRSAKQSDNMLHGILHAAQNRGYGILLLESYYDLTQETKHITKLCANRVDGIIWEPVSPSSLSSVAILERHNIPYCVTGNYNFPSAYRIDFHKIGNLLTQKLIDSKHSHIACLLKEENADSDLFLEGYHKCLYDNHLPFSKNNIYYDPGKEFIQEIIKCHYTAVVCNHYELSLSLYEMLDKQHIHIPEDFSLTSILPSYTPDVYLPEISGISVPFYDFGVHLCEDLIDTCEKIPNKECSYTVPLPLNLNHKKSIATPNSPHKNFVIVGSIHQDTTFNVSELPQSGRTLKISSSVSTLGGKGANQAVGIAKLNGNAHLIAAVGNDYDASLVLNMLDEENISTSGICRNKSSKTGKAYIYLENDGESAITILPGANDMLTPENIRKKEGFFKHCRFCLLSNEIPIETVITAAEIAKQNGVETIFKPAALKEFPPHLCENIDIFIPNRREAAELCPQYSSVEQQADFFYHLGIPTVIITLGSKGCYLKTAEHAQFFPAVNLNAIDTTGGADAFISAFATYRSEDYTLEQSIQIATIAAAFCVSRQGVHSALIDKNSLEMYLAKKHPDLLKPDHMIAG